MFRAWDSYYFMIGSAGAGLIGLFFVVVTLTQGFDRDRALRGTSIYMTPSVIHFAVVLSLSAAAVAPGLPIPATAGLFALGALVGLGNAIWATVGIASRRLGPEAPHWSDVWLYGVAPTAIYTGLFIAAIGLCQRAGWAVYTNAALLLALLLIGVRNAWDLITWMAPMRAAPLASSANGLGAVAGDQAGADRVAVDARKEEAGEDEKDGGKGAAKR
jgi:hypothetical protein